MPSTDFTITDNRVRLAVTSSRPHIKLDIEEKVADSEMTQTASIGGDSMVDAVPSTVDRGSEAKNRVATPTAKITDRDHIAGRVQQKSTADAGEGYVMTKTTKSASCGSLNNNTLTSIDTIKRVRRISSDSIDNPKVKLDHRALEDANSIEARRHDESSHPTTNHSDNPPDKRFENQAIPTIRDGENTDHNSDHDCSSESFPHQHFSTATPYPIMTIAQRHECDTCGVSFRSKETYEVHVKHYCSEKRRDIECKMCGAKFHDDTRLKTHMKVHVLRYVCLLCSKRISENECEHHLLLHVENFHIGDGLSKCPPCDVQFVQKSELFAHLRERHVTTGTVMPFLCPSHRCTSVPHPQDIFDPDKEDRVNRKKLDQNPELNQLNTPPRDEFQEMDIENMSPPLTTSTPSRTTRDRRVDIQSFFKCIVCGLGFPNVIALQRHLLTAHTSGSDKPMSPPIEQVTAKSIHRPSHRQNRRKVSTVLPPQLSLLSDPNSRHKSDERHAKSATEPPEIIATGVDFVGVNCKKRKDRTIVDDDLMTSYPQTPQNNLKRHKKDIEQVCPKRHHYVPARDHSDARRVSCPVVSSKVVSQNQFGLPGANLPRPTVEERHCLQCDIKFLTAANFRAHKQFYCASRHIQKIQDTRQTDFWCGQQGFGEFCGGSDTLCSKSHKRNVGNRSSMTSRKRSHLIPLETVRYTTPSQEGESSATKTTSVRKSCPSHLDTTNDVNSESPAAPDESQAPTLAKKHLCQECSIWFSKYDTYMAHKKYYCESRRKDRAGLKSVNSSLKSQTKRRPESSLREPISRSDHAFSGPDRKGKSSRGSSPSIETEEERPTSMTDTNASPIGQQAKESFLLPFSLYAHTDPDWLARLSFMQPLLLNQYIAMLRDTMAQGIPNNRGVFPTVSLTNFGSTRSPTPVARPRKHSADEIRFSTNAVGKEPIANLEEKNGRPSRQSCAAVINVKQEIDGSEGDEYSQNSLIKNAAGAFYRSSPLDLSNRCTEISERENTSHRYEKIVSPDVNRYHTIDLNTTVLPIVKREPKSDPHDAVPINFLETVDKNNNCNNNKPEEHPVSLEARNPELEASLSILPVQPHQDGKTISMKIREQQCKNCNARFTSLSTFIAHKKYYCTASNSGNLIYDAKPAQVAH